MSIDIPQRPSAYWAALERTGSPFDAIREIRPDGSEFWSARALCNTVEYETWRNFAAAIERAKVSIENTGEAVTSHIAGADKLVQRPQGGAITREDFELSRYGAYMVLMNGDPRKPEIASAQTYFAVKTREAEVSAPMSEDEIVAQALSITARRVEELTAKVAELEPKANLADDYLTAQGGARLVAQVAKTYGLKESDLRRFLIEDSLVFTRHAQCGQVQYDHYAQFAHHFLPRETVVQHQFGSCSHYTLYILPRGVELIGKRLRAKGLI